MRVLQWEERVKGSKWEKERVSEREGHRKAIKRVDWEGVCEGRGPRAGTSHRGTGDVWR